MADAFIPVKSSSFERLVKAAMKVLSQMTPEGRSIVKLAYKQHIDLLQEVGEYIPFTAETRMSGVKFTYMKDSINE